MSHFWPTPLPPKLVTYSRDPNTRGVLMGEGFILTRGYGFMGKGVYHPPFDTLRIGTSTDDINLKLYS